MRQLSDSEKALRSEAAPLIRTHLWQSKTPPAPKWHMGRDLDIWARLCRAGWPAEHINLAIPMLHSVDPYYRDKPTTMRVFYHKSATPLLTQCVHHALEKQRLGRKRSAHGRVSIQIEVS